MEISFNGEFDSSILILTRSWVKNYWNTLSDTLKISTNKKRILNHSTFYSNSNSRAIILILLLSFGNNSITRIHTHTLLLSFVNNRSFNVSFLFRLIRPRLTVPEGFEWNFNYDMIDNSNDKTKNGNQSTNSEEISLIHSSSQSSSSGISNKSSALSISVQLEESYCRSWNPNIQLITVIRQLRYLLESGNLSVDMSSTLEGLPTIGAFWKSFKCLSTQTINRDDSDIGGKIFLPPSVLDILYNDHDYVPSWTREFDDDGRPHLSHSPMVQTNLFTFHSPHSTHSLLSSFLSFQTKLSLY